MSSEPQPTGCLGLVGEFVGELVFGLLGLALLAGMFAAYAAAPRTTVAILGLVLAVAAVGIAFRTRSWASPLKVVSGTVGLALLAVAVWLFNSDFRLP